MWHVYILQTQKGQLYTGMTKDIEKRLRRHKEGRGAWFTRVFGVDRLLYSHEFPTRGDAMRREAEIKTWPRTKKLALIKGKIK
jgi:predicted GIY-YIG superfamily endonuclease